VEGEARAISRPSIRNILSFIGIVVMLVWPWIFFGVVWAKGGLQMNNNLAKVVKNHPQVTTYFITFICSIITLIIGELFSTAIIRFAQELVTYRKPTRPFHLTVLLAFRHQTWPWGKSVKDAKYLMTKDRWWPAVSVIICALIFPHLISSTTALLTPTSFNRTAILTGTELDISSTDAECLSWFRNALNNPDCGWQVS
jgi:Na+/H+-dicarboxylate symporter